MAFRMDIPTDAFDDVPLWNGDWDEITDGFLEDSEEDLARAGVRYLREFAEDHIRAGRGTYVRKLRADVFGGRWTVHDQRSLYGPWLAGSSARNRSSVFKGYPHWEQARELLDNRKVDIIAPKLRGYRRKLRGGGGG